MAMKWHDVCKALSTAPGLINATGIAKINYKYKYHFNDSA